MSNKVIIFDSKFLLLSWVVGAHSPHVQLQRQQMPNEHSKMRMVSYNSSDLGKMRMF